MSEESEGKAALYGFIAGFALASLAVWAALDPSRDSPNLIISEQINMKENYLEIIQGKDTLKYHKINDSTYGLAPKEILEAQNKLDSLKQDYQNKLEKELK